VKFVKYDNGFNRLARRAEWAGDTEDGEGDNG
jgi:ATP-dependent helicase/nuclease subunit B